MESNIGEGNSKISVIVPVYNAEKYIDDCVNSVMNQTFLNWELILVDDGSSDSSGKIADKYTSVDNRIKVCHLNQNSGVSAARNKGLEIAEGDYISFLDADDELTSDCLGLLLKVAIEEQADIVSGKSCGLNDVCAFGLGGGFKVIWNGEDSLKKSLEDNPFTYGVFPKLFHKEFLAETRFNPQIRINEDSFFIFQLCCKKPCFVCIDNAIYRYRDTPNSLSRAKFSERFFDILRVSDLKYKIIEDSFPDLLSLAQNMRLKARMNLLHNLALQNNRQYRPLERELLLWVRKNKGCYIPATSADDKWLFVLEHHLYYPYKVYKRFC